MIEYQNGLGAPLTAGIFVEKPGPTMPGTADRYSETNSNTGCGQLPQAGLTGVPTHDLAWLVDVCVAKRAERWNPAPAYVDFP